MKRSNWIGPTDQFDYMGAMQFCNLFMLGMRSHNTLLDFGCGSLRLGRFAIQFLDPGNYCGIEPNAEIVNEGVKLNHLKDLIKAKDVRIRISDDCDMAWFQKKFDYIMAQSVFTHMPKSQIKLTLASAKGVMKRSSLFVANYKHGIKNYEGDVWTQKNITYRPEAMMKMISESGLTASPIHLIHTHLQTWLLIRR
jgi:cyclopropane fatty-acyl-phospholipid synthase-like methyltransferase